MNHAECLKGALGVLHKIAMGAHAARQLELGHMPKNETLRASQIARAMGYEAIETLAIETWEAIVTTADPSLAGTVIHECNPLATPPETEERDPTPAPEPTR